MKVFEFIFDHRYPEKKVKVIYFTFFYHQVLCQLVEGENNFTFEFLGVKVQEPVHNSISVKVEICGNVSHICLFGKDQLKLCYQPRQSDYKVQLVYIVCR